MSFIHDVIKRQYVYEGYLPNYPYHLISDKEMFDAFMGDGGYFSTNYPESFVSSDSTLLNAYNQLKSNISTYIDNYLSDPTNIAIPDWVYSYMMGVVISPTSNTRDIHDLLVLMGEDNLDDIFTVQASLTCLSISKEWINKLPMSDRVPTMFGEPHVIKSLRLNPLYR